MVSILAYTEKEFAMIKLGYILAVLLSLGFAVSVTNTAYANDLAIKWTQSRQVANSLGDAAKAGDKAAFTKLSELANHGDNGPAMHNMGWLLDNGYYVEKDKQAACDWYKKSADLTDYPPSMHGYALCLFRGTKGKKSGDDEVLGRELMFDAYMMGWAKSAIILSEKILNDPFLDKGDAFQAFSVSKSTLRTTSPTPDEFSSLQYLVGMATIYGFRDIDQYREGHAAMSITVSSGHLRANEALADIEILWVNEVVRKIETLESYENSTAKRFVENCHESLADQSLRFPVIEFCKKTTEIEFEYVRQLEADYDYLASWMVGESGEKIRPKYQKLNTLAKPYRRAKRNWEMNFIPKYNARALEHHGSP
ncbi:MAG: hypothetical protein COB56_04250 [Robiginitomaculum sp.]|nr:MAG: hypothetical protein COB56_04250 [Robiginitomaculum sp.]